MRLRFAVLLLIAAPAAFSQAQPGTNWDITTSMKMEGMKLPGQKQQVCVPANAEGPDAMSGDDERCKMSDMKSSPGRYSYKVTCPDGSGTGEMIYHDKDSYTSKMTITADGDTVVIVSEGRRTGSCDASKQNKQVAAVQAQANAALKQSCSTFADALLPASLDTNKCSAKDKQQLCNKLNTQEGYRRASERQPSGDPTLDSGLLPAVENYCGVAAGSTLQRLCDDANRREDLDFLGAQCPALAAPIAQRECAGRSYSTPPAEKYRDFCNSYAREIMQGSGDTSIAPKTQDVLKEGAKRLKGLFGR
jgi:hypothetical protein